METRAAELHKEAISVTDGSRFGYVGDMEVDLESGQVRAHWWCRGGCGCSACWAGRRTAISPGTGCGGLGRTSSWWSRSPSLGHCAAAGERGAERERPAGHRPAGLSL